MTLEDRLSELNNQLRDLVPDKRSLVEQQIRARWLMKEAQKALEHAKEIRSSEYPPLVEEARLTFERAKKVWSVMYPPKDSSGQESAP